MSAARVLPPNPFDHRRAVPDDRGLVGRGDECGWFASALERLREGSTAHGLVIGEEGFGKTSLLNAFGATARRERFVCASLTLNAKPASPTEFFNLVLNAIMLDLIKAGVLENDSDEVRRWERQAHGERERDERPFLLAYDHTPCDLAVLCADLDRLAAIARAAGYGGVAVLVDNGDHLLGGNCTAPLSGLFDRLDHYVFVVAATPPFLLALSQRAPELERKLQVLHLEGFSGLLEYTELLLGPLPDDAKGQTALGADDMFDVRYASGGSPRLIRLIGSLMWEAAERDGFGAFGLSRAILVRLCRSSPAGEPKSFAEEVVERFLKGIDGLQPQELEALRPLASLADNGTLSPAAAALIVLAEEQASLLTEEAYRDLRERLAQRYENLTQRQLVQKEFNWYRFAGGGLSKAYLRRSIRERMGTAPAIPGNSYGVQVSTIFFQHMLRAASLDWSGREVAVRFRAAVPRDDVEYTEFRSERIAEGIGQRDALTLLRENVALYHQAHPPTESKVALLVVAVEFEVGSPGETVVPLDEVPSGAFDTVIEAVEIGCGFWVDPAINAATIARTIETWFSANPIPKRYVLRPRNVRAVLADPELADQLLAAAAVHSVAVRAAEYLSSERVEDGQAFLMRATEALEAAYAYTPSPAKRFALLDARQRLALLATLNRDADTAEQAIVKAAELRGQRTDLDYYNLGLVRALRGEYAAAAERARLALELLEERSLTLQVFFPPLPGRKPEPRPKYTTVRLKRGELRGVIETQILIFDALAGRFGDTDLKRASRDLSATAGAHPMCNRLAAWLILVRFRSLSAAEIHFQLAMNAGSAEAQEEFDIARAFFSDPAGDLFDVAARVTESGEDAD